MTNVIGTWIKARQKDGQGFMIIEVTGIPENGNLPAMVVHINLAEVDADAYCIAHNRSIAKVAAA
jgi:hypothetical protein